MDNYKNGTLMHNADAECLYIAFDDGTDSDQLHCGDYMEANLDGMWTPVRIEYSHTKEEWFFIGHRQYSLDKMSVRLMR